MQNMDLARENDLASKIVADVTNELEKKGAVQSKYTKILQFRQIRYLNRTLFTVDPCTKVRCGAGRVCKAEDNIGTCVCIPECPEESDPRRKVNILLYDKLFDNIS